MTKSLHIALAAGLFSVVGLAAPVITNGTFSSGDTGFTNNQLYVGNGAQGTGQSGCGASSMIPEDTYAVAQRPSDCHPSWLNFTDHTGDGAALMLLVNGSVRPGDNIAWQQSVGGWEAGHSYTLTAWARNAFTQGPAILQFFVDGTPVTGTLQLFDSGVSGWQQLAFDCGPAAPCTAPGPHTLTIRNTQTLQFGNDFAIDDISIRDNGVVPEPTTSALMAAGLIGLALIRRKK